MNRLREVTKMETITLNDGTTYDKSHAILSGDNLFLYICDGTSDIKDAFNALTDAEKTAKIETSRYGIESTYEGFTHFKSISEDSATQISVYLTK